MTLSHIQHKKIALLGIGYIGLNLLNFFKKSNINVIPITRKNVGIIETEEFDYFINTSGNSGNFRDQLIQTIDSNIRINTYILEKAKIREKYIYISSSRVYGFSNNKNEIFNEESFQCSSHLDINFIYDGSKKLAESLLFNYSKNVNYPIIILRLSNVYGDFDCLDDKSLIKKITRYKKEKKTDLHVGQNRYSTKDYIHVRDIVQIIAKVMTSAKQTDIYNVASGKSYSLDDISRIIDLNINTDETIQETHSNISNQKLIKDFDITFNYNFEDALQNIIIDKEKNGCDKTI